MTTKPKKRRWWHVPEELEFPIERNGPNRIRVVHDLDVTHVYFDGVELGELVGQEARKKGQEFETPTGKRLSVSGWDGRGGRYWWVYYDGKPVPGATGSAEASVGASCAYLGIFGLGYIIVWLVAALGGVDSFVRLGFTIEASALLGALWLSCAVVMARKPKLQYEAALVAAVSFGGSVAYQFIVALSQFDGWINIPPPDSRFFCLLFEAIFTPLIASNPSAAWELRQQANGTDADKT